MGDTAYRINEETIPQMKKSFKEEKNESLKKEKY